MTRSDFHQSHASAFPVPPTWEAAVELADSMTVWVKSWSRSDDKVERTLSIRYRLWVIDVHEKEGHWPIEFVQQMNSFRNEPCVYGKAVECIQQQHVRDVSLDCPRDGRLKTVDEHVKIFSVHIDINNFFVILTSSWTGCTPSAPQKNRTLRFGFRFGICLHRTSRCGSGSPKKGRTWTEPDRGQSICN